MPQPKMPGIYRSCLVWCSPSRRAVKNKNELPAARIHRQCNPKAIEVTFLSVPAIDFFAQDQLQALQDWYLALGQGLESIDATVKCTKPTSEATAVTQTLLCRYHLGLGIYNVQAAVEGMDGSKQERNKSSYSHTRERRQLLNKCQLVMATGGTIAQDLTMQWSTLGGFMQDLFLLAGDR